MTTLVSLGISEEIAATLLGAGIDSVELLGERINAEIDLQGLPGIGPQWDLKLRQLAMESANPSGPDHTPAIEDSSSVDSTTDRTVSEAFPMQDVAGHHSRHVQVRLSREHAAILSGLREGLKANHAQLEDGRHVEQNADVVRYLLEFAKSAVS